MSAPANRRKTLIGFFLLAAAALLTAGLIIIYACGQGVFSLFILRPPPPKDIPVNERPFSAEREEWRKKYASEEWTLVTRDGLTLRARHYSPEEKGTNWILLASGVQGQTLYLEDLVIDLHGRGYHVLVPELRGHGESGGELLGWGVPDKQDMLLWVRQIEETDEGAQIVLFGFSAGGAAALLASPETPRSVTGIISDSAYSELEKEFSHLLREKYALPAFPLVAAGSVVCGGRADWSFGEGDVISAVADSRVPLLFIHGGEDDFAPPEMAEELFNAAAGEPPEKDIPGTKEILIVPGAGHCRALNADPAGYMKAVDGFLSRFLPISTPDEAR
ncbi:MAG: alpha/beta hydrolase [Oscillospiraceae bacterium]|jgi:alpha-beta hydrolase superfamily lysophospholipase|nr:alpha/beta hydrolase [Oscillospiraceae bacterium]